MDFASILNEWDKRSPQNTNFSKDEENLEENMDNERRRLLLKKPDAYIDLHGLIQEEAWDNLDEFFKRSRSKGFEKVLVIHGKGNHSKSEGVLGELCRKYIEQCPFAGTSGHNSGAKGGSGATWVLLKH
ncbi:MAG: Smr/MutS family protein [Treponema sp.]|nr:Smr/MutS family protein [Treponema sp.]